MKDGVVALASGGLDSAVLVGLLAEQGLRVIPTFVREGLAWEAAELHHLERFLAAIARPGIEPLEVLDLPIADILGAHWSFGGQPVPDRDSADHAVYLPGRNLLLIAKAAVLAAECGAGAVALGTLCGNPFPDATPEFFATMASACSLALGRPFEVMTPLAGKAKREVLELGAGLPLELTFSCLAPQGVEPCGACNKCAERQRAFAEAGRTDPTPYRANIAKI